ncbi:MAG TPA: M15 family metallopeptidase, partial [Gemmatimonadales bacterium]|nr:M15 family metallopeptidase [Gemmatimonadales bacterium]
SQHPVLGTAVLGTAALLLACDRAAAPAPPAPEIAPKPPPAAIALLVGDYAAEGDTLSLREEAGRLEVVRWRDSVTARAIPQEAVEAGPEGRGLRVRFQDRAYERIALGPAEGNVFRISPLRPVEELRRIALAATPPAEKGEFLPTDLVELVTLDSTIKLDIRYATTDNFMSAVFYSSPRAFLQRPAAEALARAHQKLAARGYGLLIHDGYRPWYVTRMFWDATPDSLRLFVADPSQGSRHNRGAAVDLTLYDRSTGQPVEMPGVYDEFSPRSFPHYPGSTSRQRWHRELLREAMEAEGFAVYPAEWWHFDYGDWRRFRIGNSTFEELTGH